MGPSDSMLTLIPNRQPVVTVARSDQGRQLVWMVRPQKAVRVVPREKTKNCFHRDDFRAI